MNEVLTGYYRVSKEQWEANASAFPEAFPDLFPSDLESFKNFLSTKNPEVGFSDDVFVPVSHPTADGFWKSATYHTLPTPIVQIIKGDTLGTVAARFGKAKDFKKIYQANQANRSAIQNINRIKVGGYLDIPQLDSEFEAGRAALADLNLPRSFSQKKEIQDAAEFDAESNFLASAMQYITGVPPTAISPFLQGTSAQNKISLLADGTQRLSQKIRFGLGLASVAFEKAENRIKFDVRLGLNRIAAGWENGKGIYSRLRFGQVGVIIASFSEMVTLKWYDVSSQLVGAGQPIEWQVTKTDYRALLKRSFDEAVTLLQKKYSISGDLARKMVFNLQAGSTTNTAGLVGKSAVEMAAIITAQAFLEKYLPDTNPIIRNFTLGALPVLGMRVAQAVSSQIRGIPMPSFGGSVLSAGAAMVVANAIGRGIDKMDEATGVTTPILAKIGTQVIGTHYAMNVLRPLTPYAKTLSEFALRQGTRVGAPLVNRAGAWVLQQGGRLALGTVARVPQAAAVVAAGAAGYFGAKYISEKTGLNKNLVWAAEYAFKTPQRELDAIELARVQKSQEDPNNWIAKGKKEKQAEMLAKAEEERKKLAKAKKKKASRLAFAS